MVLRTSIFIVALFALFSCNETVQTGDNTQRSELPDGEQLYLENCTSCHGIDGTLGKAGSKDLSKTTLTMQQLQKIVAEGTNNGMPRFKEILGDDAALDATVEYIMGFKRING